MATRVRLSLQEVEANYISGKDKKTLETLIRAFRAISLKKPDYDLPPEEDKSFFRMAGFHGEPFEGPGKYYGDWWGGYCHHNDVLFPTWHRAYLLHFENALREVEGCQDLALPFWDELADVFGGQSKKPIPKILTEPKFMLDNKEIDNPLFSYKLQQQLVEVVTDKNHRYSKPEGYETVRYPLSGLVGTPEDRKKTAEINAQYATNEQRVEILNSNVYAWLDQGAVINKDGDKPETRYPDVSSVKARFLAVFNNSEYTAFSNKKSMEPRLAGYVGPQKTSIEDPHNAIHLALGGFFQQAEYNANPIRDANGDMGDNETAGFDPIFFFHHCFIDYVFDLWQKKFGYTEFLPIDRSSPGAFSQEGSVGVAPRTPLDENSYLIPFRNPNFKKKEDITIENPPWLTTSLVTNTATQLGYTYGVGSLTGRREVMPITTQDHSLASAANEFVKVQATGSIDRSKYPGSFVIRTYAVLPSKKEFEINREAVLSRYNIGACTNCQTRLTTRAVTPISSELEQALLEFEPNEKEAEKITYVARISHRGLGEGSGLEASFGKMHLDDPIPVGGY